mmetsp:Transcript_33087/g.43559  ORF Transcript_33087/g.43559 Transcript_33087/m.43559 type:complete len:293 (+) Transcript_33087:43-921(+)
MKVQIFQCFIVLLMSSCYFAWVHQTNSQLKTSNGFSNNFVAIPQKMNRQIPKFSSTMLLKSQAIDSNDESGNGQKVLDTEALVRYFGATALQMGTINIVLFALNYGLGMLGEYELIQKVAVFLFFGFMSVKSRTFSILDNSRPNPESQSKRNAEMKRPSWMPPPLAFPIIWSTIGLLRAISATIIWETLGHTLLAFPIEIFMLHLSIGDTWNTINNVEKRLGAAVPGVFCVLMSVYYLVFTYFNTSTLAGYIIAPSAVWLSVATLLVTTLWRLNSEGIEDEPLYPYKVLKEE